MTSFGSCIFFFKVMQNIAYTQSITAHLVRISRTNTFSGGSYFRISLGCFVCCIQNTMSRKNQMSFLRDVQTFFQRMSACFQRLSFCLEQRRIKYHSITNDVHFITLEYSRRDRTKHIFLTFKFKSMSGIRASLKTSNHIVTGSQHIDYFTFSFVAPL